MPHHLIRLPDRMLACLLLVLLLPVTALAQTRSLHVAIRDVDGRGIPDIAVVVRTEDGQELARALTGPDGAATFEGLDDVVRVQVSGQPRGGPALYQLGDDALGVRFDLGQAREQVDLDLRVDRDGLVLPDPATMISLEAEGPEAELDFVLPTAALATPAQLPTTSPADTAGVVSVAAPQRASREDAWVPIMTVLIVVVAGALLLANNRRRNAP